jgi:hypothetical protein
MVAYASGPVGKQGRGVGEGVQTGAGRQRKCAGSRKKILNRGNEPKNLFKAKELAFLGAKNELVFQCQKTQTKRKIGANKYDSETGNRKIEAGNTHLGHHQLDSQLEAESAVGVGFGIEVCDLMRSS